MQDFIILQGKNYISSRRASQATGYDPDYIGQLFRSGKVGGTIISRLLFVEESSLLEYKAKNGRQPYKHAEKSNVENRQVRGEKAKASKSQKPKAEVREEKFISSKEASQLTGYSSDYIGQLCRSSKIKGKMVGRALFVEAAEVMEHRMKNGRQPYKHSARSIRRQEKLQAKLERKKLVALHEEKLRLEKEKLILAVPSLAAPTVISSMRSVPQAMLKPSPYPFLKIGKKVSLGAGIFVMGLIILGAVIHRPSAPLADAASQPASIADIPQAIGRFVSDLFDSGYSHVAMLFGHEHSPIAVLPPTSGSSSGNPADDDFAGSDIGKGMTVTASAGAAEDEAAKKNIQDSFSDAVSIAPDKSGTAGVITPVFKKAQGDKFLYVMVPVKTAPKAGDTAKPASAVTQ